MSFVTYMLVAGTGLFVAILTAEVAILAVVRRVQRRIRLGRERRRRTRILFLADVAHLVHVTSYSDDSSSAWLAPSATRRRDAQRASGSSPATA